MRAKQDRAGDTRSAEGLALLIHGDAAFAGEGVVQETLNLSQLDGLHASGGTIHIVVNNQIGFTTAASEARSSPTRPTSPRCCRSRSSTSTAKTPRRWPGRPLAMDFRQEFQRDVVIDMYCYRRHGHNEGDEPASRSR